MESNRRGKNKVGGGIVGGIVKGFGIGLSIIVIVCAYAFLVANQLDRPGATERAEMQREIRWLKTRVANLEGYAAHLEAEIKGLEFFDVVFTGDQSEAMRPLYDAAVEAEFERIKKGGGVTE